MSHGGSREVKMLNLVVFETEEELCELTGLTEQELWEKSNKYNQL